MKKGLALIAFCTAFTMGINAQASPIFTHIPLLPAFKGTDEQIAGVVLAVNSAEIMEARVVLYSFLYSLSKVVSDYAKEMLDDSKLSNFNAVALFKKNNIVPEDSAMSGDILSQATDQCSYYVTLNRPDFYKAFSHDQVGSDQSILLALNYILIISAKNPELKATLQQMVSMIQKHLILADELEDIFY